MAEKYPSNNKTSSPPPPETKERGCFDFMHRKKEDKTPLEDDLMKTDLNTAQEKHTLMDELRRTHTLSSSSSEEEVEEGGERRKKKKKKGLKDAITTEGEEDTCITTEKLNEDENGKTAVPDEKKGFIEKIKEKLPGQLKTGEEDNAQAPPACEHSPGSDSKEKKGIIDKIMEKFPGHHKSNGNEVKQD